MLLLPSQLVRLRFAKGIFRIDARLQRRELSSSPPHAGLTLSAAAFESIAHQPRFERPIKSRAVFRRRDEALDSG
jgi:hypothetical protein